MDRTSRMLFGMVFGICCGQALAAAPIGNITVSPWGNPANVVFGNQAVGTVSAPQNTTLTATLVGGGPGDAVQIDAIAVSPTGDFVKGAGCDPSTTLPHNGTCNFPTSFAPSAAGPRAAVVTITCQVVSLATIVSVACDNSPHTLLNLSGNGIALSQIPSLGRTGVTLLALALFALALARLRRV